MEIPKGAVKLNWIMQYYQTPYYFQIMKLIYEI